MNIRLVALAITGTIAVLFASGATYSLIVGEIETAAIFGTLLGAPAVVIYDLIRNKNGSSIPPAAKVLLCAALGSAAMSMQGCGAVCDIYDASHETACALCNVSRGSGEECEGPACATCAATSMPCPFEPDPEE